MQCHPWCSVPVSAQMFDQVSLPHPLDTDVYNGLVHK